MGEIEYNLEEDELLTKMIDTRFFDVFKNPYHTLWNSTAMELYITSDCNLKCEYCYLNARGDKLYPIEHKSKEEIMKNLSILLDYMANEGFAIKDLQLFSGEIWHTNWGFEVLDLIYDALQKGLIIQTMTTPTNSTFISSDETTERMQEYVDKFNNINTRLCISHSIEGKYLEDITRESKVKSLVRDDTFYDKLFTFAKKNTFYFHPMVSSGNVKYWKENFDWFEEQCKKFDMPFPSSVMMLEVRNNDWTDESLEDLCSYYKHEIDWYWKASNYDFDRFMALAFGIRRNEDSDITDLGYSNIALTKAESYAGCSIPSTITVRLGDLMIVPCHRLSYPQFNYGQFMVEDDKISGIKSNNTPMMMKIVYSNNFLSHHKCDTCPYLSICLRGCYGSQYENTEEAFMPDENVCKMFKTKYNFLIDKYIEMGLLQYASKIPATDRRYLSIQTMLNSVDTILTARRESNE